MFVEDLMKEIKKEDVENLSYKDITFLLLENNKKGMNTLDLFGKIVSLLELPASRLKIKLVIIILPLQRIKDLF